MIVLWRAHSHERALPPLDHVDIWTLMQYTVDLMMKSPVSAYVYGLFVVQSKTIPLIPMPLMSSFDKRMVCLTSMKSLKFFQIKKDSQSDR